MSVRVSAHEVAEVLFEACLQTVHTVQTSVDLLHSEILHAEQLHVLRLTQVSGARGRLLVRRVFRVRVSIAFYVRRWMLYAASVFLLRVDRYCCHLLLVRWEHSNEL